MRRALSIALVSLAVTVAILISPPLSDETLAVLVGIIFGIAATLPVSLGLWLALTRHWSRNDFYSDEDPHAQTIPPSQPPALFVTRLVRPTPSYASDAQYACSSDAYFATPQSDFRIVENE